MTPLTKLVLSRANIRKTAREAELAVSIGAQRLLQRLAVRPMLDADDKETGNSNS